MRIFAAILVAAFAIPAQASFHLWYVNEAFSNADGSVQYIELMAAASGQQFVAGHTIRVTQGGTTHSYTLPSNLPGDTAEGSGDPTYGGYYGGGTTYKTMLIATQGFAALNVVTPDYVVPNGFLFVDGGTINWGEGSDTWTYPGLPTDGRARYRDGTLASNSPQNFAGTIGSVSLAASVPSYQGLWINANESGWGINFTQQGTTLFATWFTYDTDGSGMWLVMSDGAQTAPGKFSGQLLRTTGPGFDAQPFTAISTSNYTPVGTLSVTFADTNTASITYTVNGVTQTKSITRFVFGVSGSTCTIGGTAGATNYTDLWWHDLSESGWGVNLVHQGNIVFATWFTYQAGGTAAAPAKGMWLVMSQANQTAPGVFTGTLQRTTGPNAFSSTTPFNPSLVQRNDVGSATLTFSGPNAGTFDYTVNGVHQVKTIQRIQLATPSTVCN